MSARHLFNTDYLFWKSIAEEYQKQGDARTVKVLEGMVWTVPMGGTVAQFESNEEAEKVLLAAGFKFISEAGSKTYQLSLSLSSIAGEDWVKTYETYFLGNISPYSNRAPRASL